jgi:hypothetical protein
MTFTPVSPKTGVTLIVPTEPGQNTGYRRWLRSNAEPDRPRQMTPTPL